MPAIECSTKKRNRVAVCRTRSRRPCSLLICSRQMTVLQTATRLLFLKCRRVIPVNIYGLSREVSVCPLQDHNTPGACYERTWMSRACPVKGTPTPLFGTAYESRAWPASAWIRVVGRQGPRNRLPAFCFPAPPSMTGSSRTRSCWDDQGQ